MDFLHLEWFLLFTSLVFMSKGVCLPNPTSSSWPSSIVSTRLTLLIEGIPNIFHLKNPFFFPRSLSSCTCMELQWHWSRRTSSFNFLISVCWDIISRLEWHRVGASSPGFGLLVPLKEPLQSIWPRLSLLCSEKITWITARTGKRSFWAAWRDASGESFRLSISLQRFFLSCFDVLGCACQDANVISTMCRHEFFYYVWEFIQKNEMKWIDDKGIRWNGIKYIFFLFFWKFIKERKE